jgi:endonuclease VIII
MDRPAPPANLGSVPEGDTIHYAASRIRSVLERKVPHEILTPQPRHRFDRWPERLAGRALRSVDPLGKHLFLRFEGGLTLHSHLRMSGAWRVGRQGEPWLRARRRAWLLLRWEGWEIVQFDGPVLELMSDVRTRTDLRFTSLGQDVLGESFDEGEFLRRLRSEEQQIPVGEALLSQRTVAGIGNVWKCEACFGTGTDPWRALGRLSDEELLALLRFCRRHMPRSAREGWQARPRTVYGAAGRPCPRCATTVLQRGQGEHNRPTFWCPGCQR